MEEIKQGDRLFTGAIVTERFAKHYNQLSRDIEQKEKYGMNVEALKNGRHNLFNAYAVSNKK